MKYRMKYRMKYHRCLLVDHLEDRRLLAGLDVSVFDDPLSARMASPSSIPAAHRVVYLDLNADGTQQALEPMSISDIDGIARFRNIDPGTYLVRLLGSSKSQLQTTDTEPAPAGSWIGNVGASRALVWQSDTVGWFASSQSVIELDIERGVIQNQLAMPGRILSAAMENQTRGTALVAESNLQTELIGFDLQLGEIQRFNHFDGSTQSPLPSSGVDKELLSIGNTTFLRRSTALGDSLLRIPSRETWQANSSLDLILSGISANAQLQPIGSQGLLISESLADGSRITLLKYDGVSFELIAERSFDSSVRISSSSPQSNSFAVETSLGIEILSASSGLPTTLVLDQATGPTLIDTSRGLLWSLSKANTSRLIGWTITEGLKAVDVLFADAGTKSNATRTQFSLGHLSDTLIGLRDGQVYRHSLSIARGTVAQIVDQVIEQVAIGIRSRGQNSPPVLGQLPDVRATEDTPAAIKTSDWTQATSDSDGDPVYFILVREGQLGTVSWNTSTGGAFLPKSDANGQDQIVVQAYDGRGWSTPQTVGIQIQAVNDAPQGLLFSGVLAIPEKRPGYVLGNLAVMDPDANEVFDYSVSDPRFEVVGNTLKVTDSAVIPYQAPGWIDLRFLARSRTNGDTIERPERIFIVKDPTPFHNDSTPEDVDGDGRITPLDPLVIINYINSNGSGRIRPPGEGEAHIDLDVDGDGQVSPLDILIVINALNQPSGGAEGENNPGSQAGSPPPSDIEDPLGLKKPRR